MAKRTPSQKLLRHHSPWRLVTKFLAVVILVAIAYALRYKVVESVRVPDNGVLPDAHLFSRIWICKLSRCIDHAPPGTLTAFEARPGQFLLRKLTAGPGATLHGQVDGTVFAPNFKLRLRDDSWFLDSATIRVPRKNDSLVFANLGPAEFDLAMRLYRLQEPNSPAQVRATLWVDGHQVPIERAAGASLHGIPIKLKDIGSYNWQEIKLLEMQVLHTEYGASHVHIQRELMIGPTLVHGFRVQQDCYFLLCTQGRGCVDSREIGYITRPHIRGVQFNRKLLAKK